jgi:Ureidoglycolate hydrolase.
MKQVSVKKLTVEGFKEYGYFANLINPDSRKFAFETVAFHPDMVFLDLGQVNKAAFSVTRVEKRPLIIDAVEYHNFSGEGMLPLDGDVLMHLAPPTQGNELQLDSIEVFYIPKGTIVSLRKGVWHCAPYAINTDFVNMLVVLPERTYANDCYFMPLPEAEQIEIVT